MTDRPRFFDDIAGVAGGAFSAFSGLREEMQAMVRARIDETLASLEVVRREDLDAVRELAARARMGQDAAEARITALETRLAALETAAHPAEAAPNDDAGANHAPASQDHAETPDAP